jgi:hypothetical protein
MKPEEKKEDPFGWDRFELLPETSSDERGEGWGEERPASSADDLRRFLDEKPPHHL